VRWLVFLNSSGTADPGIVRTTRPSSVIFTMLWSSMRPPKMNSPSGWRRMTNP
jgi:hypothetical protein